MKMYITYMIFHEFMNINVLEDSVKTATLAVAVNNTVVTLEKPVTD